MSGNNDLLDKILNTAFQNYINNQRPAIKSKQGFLDVYLDIAQNYADSSNLYDSAKASEKFDAIKNKIDYTYINDEHKINLKSALNRFEQLEKQYAEFIDGKIKTLYFESDLLKYIDTYSEILRYVYLSNVNQGTNIAMPFIPDVLKLGIDENNNVTMYSPHVASATFMFVHNVIQYTNCIEFKQLSKEDILKIVFTHIFVNNAQLRFKRYIIYKRDNDSLAVELIKIGGSDSPCECVPLSETGGIEDIRPVRLGEKIMMAFKEWRTTLPVSEPSKHTDNNKPRFTVGIIGNIRGNKNRNGIETRLKELAETLHKCLEYDFEEEKINSEYKIDIEWYLLRQDNSNNSSTNGVIITVPAGKGSKCEINITLNDDRNDSNRFFEEINGKSTKKLKEFINKFSLMFFLDCPNLYYAHEFQTINSTDYYTNYVSKHGFRDYYEIYRLDRNLYNSGFTFGLMSNISGHSLNNKAEHGKVFHKVNITMIDYMRGYIKKQQEYKSIYIFLSSDTAMADSDYNKRNIVREERYNGKSFDVVNIHNNSKGIQKLEIDILNTSKKPKGTIVLSLYQIIKNIDRDIISEPVLYSVLFPGEDPKKEQTVCDIIYRMRAVYICFSYQAIAGKGRNGIFETKIQYYIDDNRFGKDKTLIKLQDNYNKIAKIVKLLSETLFEENMMPGDEFLSLLNVYKLNFYTALYSSVKSIDDMLYLHLLRDRYALVQLEKSEPEKIIINPSEYELRYFEDKKMYSDIMKECDQVKISYIQQYSIKDVIEKINGNNVKKVAEDIKTVCERYGYTGSYLLTNIEAVGGTI